jgi:hypothetical protein
MHQCRYDSNVHHSEERHYSTNQTAGAISVIIAPPMPCTRRNQSLGDAAIQQQWILQKHDTVYKNTWRVPYLSAKKPNWSEWK